MHKLFYAPQLPIIAVFSAALLFLAACDPASSATPEPTYALSAPTLEASPVFFPLAPTSDLSEFHVAGQNDPTAAAAVSGGELPPLPIGTAVLGDPRQQVIITAGDGAQLNASLYLPLSGEPANPVLLLAESTDAWGSFPLQLLDEGLAVLSLDLRPNAPLGDVLAAFNALTGMSVIDVSSIGMVGAGAGADLALAACGIDIPCGALALISPQTASEQGIFAYNPRPLFMAAASDNTASIAAINTLRAVARGTIELPAVAGSGGGAPLIAADTTLAARLTDWLRTTLNS